MSARAGPLLGRLLEAGGVASEDHGVRLVRHFGDPSAEYRAAAAGAAVFDRSHRSRLWVSGRAPGRMLDGVLTGTLPRPPVEAGGGLRCGRGTYHAVLTPKGRMITDLWALLPGDEASPGFLLDVPAAGREGLLAHLRTYLPPRFASVADRTEDWAALTVVGPSAAGTLARLALGLRAEPELLSAGDEGAWWSAASPGEGLIVMRTREVWPEAFDVYGPTAAVAALWSRLVEEGVTPAGLGVWTTLRVEAGRPAFGIDMDDTTIPVEAGIHERAIDYGKGCYTGQEVIVRIRDRGQVNRHLRLLELGEGPTPAAGAELHAPGGESAKPVGFVTSAVDSPRRGGVIALAYVRRGIDRVVLAEREVDVPSG